MTPLHYACQENHIDIAKILIDHKANIEALTKFHRTPL